MKFTLLIASVSAITLVKNAPDSKEDPTHQYSIKVNDSHKAITDKSDNHQVYAKAVLDSQEMKDAWRGKFDSNYPAV